MKIVIGAVRQNYFYIEQRELGTGGLTMNDKKANIVNFIKVFLLLFMMAVGFWFTYCLMWHTLILPLTDWAVWICAALAVASEFGYYKWLRE